MVKAKAKAKAKAMGKIPKAKAKDMQEIFKTTEKAIKVKQRDIKEKVTKLIVAPHGGEEPVQPQHIIAIGNLIGELKQKEKAKNIEGHPLSVNKIETNA